MTLMARYSATCPKCGGRWQPGDLIRAEATPPGELHPWKHAVCPDDDPLDSRGEPCPCGCAECSEPDTLVEALDALPVGSVIYDVQGQRYERREYSYDPWEPLNLDPDDYRVPWRSSTAIALNAPIGIQEAEQGERMAQGAGDAEGAVQTVAEALDFAAGCSCCASNDRIADVLGIDHCGDPSSQMCDLDEDLSGDIKCDWHRAELSFRDLAQRAIDAAINAARPDIEREPKAEAWDEGARAALGHAVRSDDGITLWPEWPENPYRIEREGQA